MGTIQARGDTNLESETVIRVLETPDEMDACVELQRRAWGFTDLDLIPKRVFVVTHKIGGQVLGAWIGDRLVGFSMALPGHRPGQTYWHSHMLAVEESQRNRGLGRRLKLEQREGALAQGIELIEWTFDPLEIKNGYFNLCVLGAMARRYHPNFYGQTSNRFQAGLPSDRLTAEWWLRSARAQAVAQGSPLPPPDITAEVSVPGAIQQWKDTQDPRALATQTHLREQLTAAFASGLAVVGYRKDETVGTFQLGPERQAEVSA
ncbi:MAG: GNAT family N-acetyltransferase [Terriglobales bacterium]